MEKKTIGIGKIDLKAIEFGVSWFSHKMNTHITRKSCVYFQKLTKRT